MHLPSTQIRAVAIAAVLAAAVLVGITAASAKATSRSVQPRGIGGRWKLTFDAEFNHKRINHRSWSTRNNWTDQNDVTDRASNVSDSNGSVNLKLSSRTVGAEIATNSARLRVGDFAQARIKYPGRGAGLHDWDGFWAAGPNWPEAGENDVAESLGGHLTVNYHSPTGTHNKGAIRGKWADGFHTYGIYRGKNFVEVYYDGRKVKRYQTDDNGKPETFIFTVGNGQHDPLATGTAGTMRIDYLRVWKRA